jgi:hypothetical protein
VGAKKVEKGKEWAAASRHVLVMLPQVLIRVKKALLDQTHLKGMCGYVSYKQYTFRE